MNCQFSQHFQQKLEFLAKIKEKEQNEVLPYPL